MYVPATALRSPLGSSLSSPPLGLLPRPPARQPAVFTFTRGVLHWRVRAQHSVPFHLHSIAFLDSTDDRAAREPRVTYVTSPLLVAQPLHSYLSVLFPTTRRYTTQHNKYCACNDAVFGAYLNPHHINTCSRTDGVYSIYSAVQYIYGYIEELESSTILRGS